ncbi:PEP-CTERM sorting domain-containing protein [Massilia sp. H6]|uniref:PEP-CTERM sorting domain-containing protein n=1 Tax=Massilia sp. H6 TaxID=2970464 RepID=UPI0021699000|nr:PEP-CTERM sorting domain-containing protein [Massilia sp. H6]UVW26922.1 PEP-CTERM sorting domain-containing protein [Massilia sp. H6]
MSTRLNTLTMAAMLCCALFTHQRAHAQITVFTDRAAFLGAVGAAGVDTYDDLSVELYAPTLQRMAGAFDYTVSAGQGLYGAGAEGDGWLSSNSPFDRITFSNFSSGVVGLGGEFFGSNLLGQFTPGTTIILTALDGSSITWVLPESEISSFVGFVSPSPLQSVVVGTFGEGYWPTANNLTLAAAVPEPGAYGMMLAGLGVVGWCRRQRRARVQA